MPLPIKMKPGIDVAVRFGTGQTLGKYRLSRKLGEGSSGEVWKARDTIEGLWVALKIPLPSLNNEDTEHHALLREVRVVASLRHPNILPVKNADIIEGRLVLATELCSGTLADRGRPLMPHRVMGIMRHVLLGLGHAHANRVVHCDVTPGNIFLLPDGRAALGDFGISRYYQPRMATMDEFGTPGYVAPEQAYGKPQFASDCFAAALITYEYLTGVLPRWPFEWPMRGTDRLQSRTNWAFARALRKAMEISPKKRFRSADEMLAALVSAAPHLFDEHAAARKPTVNWQRVRREAFLARYEKALNPEFSCVTCGEPISELMHRCPWCGEQANCFNHATAFPDYCPDCTMGVLPEWRFCAWCYGPGFAKVAEQRRADKRYKARCRHCHGKHMPFMHYCPWCRRKVRKPWRVHPFPDVCKRCRWSVDRDFWSYCPWCQVCLSAS